MFLAVAEMQIISYSFIIVKHFQKNLQFRKISLLKVRLYIFSGQWVHYYVQEHNKRVFAEWTNGGAGRI